MEHYVGPNGTADEIPVEPDHPGSGTTLCLYLITAPGYHPLWSQYMFACITLADHPDYPPAHLKFPGATHEMMLYSLDPDYTWTPESMLQAVRDNRSIPRLSPVDICEQYQATDDEMREVMELCAMGVCDGHLIPEVGDAPTRIRENWLQAVVRTLAHMRGEEHAP